jgi:hypothetical protein
MLGARRDGDAFAGQIRRALELAREVFEDSQCGVRAGMGRVEGPFDLEAAPGPGGEFVTALALCSFRDAVANCVCRL